MAIFQSSTISLYPSNVQAIPNQLGGAMSAQQYYYQATYEWTDNQGNPPQICS